MPGVIKSSSYLMGQRKLVTFLGRRPTVFMLCLLELFRAPPQCFYETNPKSVLTCSAWSETTHAPLLLLVSLAARLPLPTFYWLSDSYTPGLYTCHFPSAIHFIRKMKAARSSKMVSYHNTTWCHNP